MGEKHLNFNYQCKRCGGKTLVSVTGCNLQYCPKCFNTSFMVEQDGYSK